MLNKITKGFLNKLGLKKTELFSSISIKYSLVPNKRPGMDAYYMFENLPSKKFLFGHFLNKVLKLDTF